MSNSYKMSNGEYVKKSVIDRKVRQAKTIVLQQQIDEFGWNFCKICERNDCLPVTCMHLEGVDSCQKNGRAEKAWDITNIIPAGIRCHAKYDKNDVRLNFNK